MFEAEIVEKIRTHILCLTLILNRAVVKQCGKIRYSQTGYTSTIECCVKKMPDNKDKNTDTQTQYLILVAL